MRIGYRSKGWSGRRVSLYVAGPALLVSLLVPAFGLFYAQWNSADSVRRVPTSPTLALQGKSSSWVSEFLNSSARLQLDKMTLGRADDPFRTSVTREMLLAKGDPFLLALVSGQAEGQLVVRGRNANGVPLLGPPIPKDFRMRITDRETFEAIQSGVGGSFSSFFAKLFGKSEHDSALSPEPSDQEDNPFSKARESLAENHAPEKQDVPVDVKPAAQAKDETAKPGDDHKESSTGAAASVGAQPVRPYLMLHVDEDGLLKTVPAAQPREGTFETAEQGVQDFNIRSFSDTADFPASIAVADFNGDGYPDVAYLVSYQGVIRLFYGSQDGFDEGLQIEAGKGPRSMAVGDFNGDGRMDLAMSDVGTGLLTLIFGESPTSYSYKVLWLDPYRDYIAAADTAQTGRLDLLGINFSNSGTVLVDFSRPEGGLSGSKFEYAPSFSSPLATFSGWTPRLNAVVLNSSLSLNLDNRMGQLVNVLNVAPGTNVYLIVGDLNANGRVTIGIGIPRK